MNTFVTHISVIDEYAINRMWHKMHEIRLCPQENEPDLLSLLFLLKIWNCLLIENETIFHTFLNSDKISIKFSKMKISRKIQFPYFSYGFIRFLKSCNLKYLSNLYIYKYNLIQFIFYLIANNAILHGTTLWKRCREESRRVIYHATSFDATAWPHCTRPIITR